MQAGISTASLFMRRENEEALPLFQRFGVACAEVFLTTFSQYNAEYGKKLAALKGDIAVNSIHDLTSQFEPQLFSRHSLVREDAYKMLGGVLAAARALGAKYYSFHGATRAKRAARLPENDDFPRLRKDFSQLADFCLDYGVTLCLENVEWSTYNRTGIFSEIATGVPSLRGVLDVKQARLSGVPYQAYLREMGERLAYAHISDITAEGKMCLPGKGIFDYERLIKELQDVGFDGALLIEAYERDYEKEEELKTSYEYIQELLYKFDA